MKNLFIIFVIILCVSCSLEQDNFYDFPEWNNKTELYWIMKSVKYTPDLETWGGDYWQTPKETWELKTGDCEDLAILWIDQIYIKYGYKSEFRMGLSYDNIWHAYAYCEELDYMFNNNRCYMYKMNVVFQYDDIWLAKLFNTGKL